jgi:hypothetical protein
MVALASGCEVTNTYVPVREWLFVLFGRRDRLVGTREPSDSSPTDRAADRAPDNVALKRQRR